MSEEDQINSLDPFTEDGVVPLSNEVDLCDTVEAINLGNKAIFGGAASDESDRETLKSKPKDLVTNFKRAWRYSGRTKRAHARSVNIVLVELYQLVASASVNRHQIHANYIENLVEKELGKKIDARAEEPRKVFLSAAKATIAKDLEDPHASAAIYADVFEALRNDNLDRAKAFAKLSNSSLTSIASEWRKKRGAGKNEIGCFDDGHLKAAVKSYFRSLPAQAGIELNGAGAARDGFAIALLREDPDRGDACFDVVRTLPGLNDKLDEATQSAFVLDRLNSSPIGPLLHTSILAGNLLGPIANLRFQIETTDQDARIYAWNMKRTSKMAKRLDVFVAQPMNELEAGSTLVIDGQDLQAISKLPQELIALAQISIDSVELSVIGKPHTRRQISCSYNGNQWECALHGQHSTKVRDDLSPHKADQSFALSMDDWDLVLKAVEHKNAGLNMIHLNEKCTLQNDMSKFEVGKRVSGEGNGTGSSRAMAFPVKIGRPLYKQALRLEAEQILFEGGAETAAVTIDCGYVKYRVLFTPEEMKSDH